MRSGHSPEHGPRRTLREQSAKGQQRRPCSRYPLWLAGAADPPADCEQRGGAGGVDSGWSPEPGRGQGGAGFRFSACTKRGLPAEKGLLGVGSTLHRKGSGDKRGQMPVAFLLS